MADEVVRVVSSIRVKSIEGLDMDEIAQEASKHVYAVLPSFGAEPLHEYLANAHHHAADETACTYCRNLAADELG